MNKSLKFQLAGYVDDGMSYSNSAEVRDIVDSSDVAKEFYETLLFANKRLEGFFQSKEMHKTNKKLHKFIDKTLEPREPELYLQIVWGGKRDERESQIPIGRIRG